DRIRPTSGDGVRRSLQALGYGRHRSECAQANTPAHVSGNNVGGDCHDDYDSHQTTEPGGGKGDRGYRIAEVVSEPNPGAGPEQHAADLVDGEPGPTDPGDARERRHDGAEPRDELGDENEPGAVPCENTLRPADAGVRPQRHPADLSEYRSATAATQLVPG